MGTDRKVIRILTVDDRALLREGMVNAEPGATIDARKCSARTNPWIFIKFIRKLRSRLFATLRVWSDLGRLFFRKQLSRLGNQN